MSKVSSAIKTSNRSKKEEALDHALVMRSKALKINRLLGSRSGMAEDFHRLGFLYALRGDLERSVRLLQRALKLERDLDRLESLADCCYNLASVHAARDQADLASRYYLEALSIDQRTGNVTARIFGHLALVQVYLKCANHTEAQFHLNAGLERIRKSGSSRPAVAGVLTEIAAMLLKHFQVVRASETLGLAQEIYEKCDHLCGLAEVTALMGVAQHLAGEPNLAEHSLREAMKLNRALGRKTRLADCCANLANLYWANDRTTDAEGLYLQALTLFIEERRKVETRRVRQLLNDLPA